MRRGENEFHYGWRAYYRIYAICRETAAGSLRKKCHPKCASDENAACQTFLIFHNDVTMRWQTQLLLRTVPNLPLPHCLRDSHSGELRVEHRTSLGTRCGLLFNLYHSPPRQTVRICRRIWVTILNLFLLSLDEWVIGKKPAGLEIEAMHEEPTLPLISNR